MPQWERNDSKNVMYIVIFLTCIRLLTTDIFFTVFVAAVQLS